MKKINIYLTIAILGIIIMMCSRIGITIDSIGRLQEPMFFLYPLGLLITTICVSIAVYDYFHIDEDTDLIN